MRRQEIHIPPDTSLCRRDPSSAQQPQTSSLFVIATGWRLANKSNAEHLPKCSNVLPSILPAIVCAFDVAPWSCERPPEVHLGMQRQVCIRCRWCRNLTGRWWCRRAREIISQMGQQRRLAACRAPSVAPAVRRVLQPTALPHHRTVGACAVLHPAAAC